MPSRAWAAGGRLCTCASVVGCRCGQQGTGNAPLPCASPLIRDVQQVCVHGEGRLVALASWHRDAVLLGVRDELGAGVQVPLAPGRNDLDIRLQAVVAAAVEACAWCVCVCVRTHGRWREVGAGRGPTGRRLLKAAR